MIVFIGANDMNGWNGTELVRSKILEKYDKGIFIEPIPEIYEKLKINLDNVNKKYNKKYLAINELITNENDKIYDFNVIDTIDNGTFTPSSIYKPLKKNFQIIKVLKIKSIRFNELIKKYNIELSKNFDIIIDVQGAELEVLKSMDQYIKNIKNMEIEFSKIKYYDNGVLFDKLDIFLKNNNFTFIKKQNKIHGNAYYTNNFIDNL